MTQFEEHKSLQNVLAAIHSTAIKETLNQNAIDPNLKCVYSVHLKDANGEKYLAEQSVFRRGYKIQWMEKSGMYELLRTNVSDYYKWCKRDEIKEFFSKGWIRAVDEAQLKRDRRRVELLNRRIGKANSERNDSLMVHWRQRRRELIERINKIEESL